MKKYIQICIFIILSISVNAQISINNSNPDPSSALQLDSKNNNQGILIPRLTANEILNIASPSNGLLAYCTDCNKTNSTSQPGIYCYYWTNGVDEKWISLPSWNLKLDLSDINNATQNSIQNIFNTNSIVQIGNNSNTNTVNVENTTKVAENVSTNKSISADNIQVISNVNANNIVMEQSSQLLPNGAIVMWQHPSEIPDGWIICDGTYSTPDLRGYFVVGKGTRNKITYNHQNSTYQNGSNKTFTLNSILGADITKLVTSQLPEHIHDVYSNGGHIHNPAIYIYSYDDVDDMDNGGEAGKVEDNARHTNTHTSSNGAHTHTIISTGENEAHNNLPPYYTLIYIMKDF